MERSVPVEAHAERRVRRITVGAVEAVGQAELEIKRETSHLQHLDSGGAHDRQAALVGVNEVRALALDLDVAAADAAFEPYEVSDPVLGGERIDRVDQRSVAIRNRVRVDREVTHERQARLDHAADVELASEPDAADVSTVRSRYTAEADPEAQDETAAVHAAARGGRRRRRIATVAGRR